MANNKNDTTINKSDQEITFIETKSPPSALDMDNLDDFVDPGKMTKADWLMAQCDLDPIESKGSMEMST